MAREKGTGNLQQEKSGRWTIRVGINGRRLSRSTGTRDRDKAEAFLNRFLAPLGLGAIRLPLAEAWHHYEMSPNRRDLARSTLESKRIVWMGFARWMEHNHIEIGHHRWLQDGRGILPQPPPHIRLALGQCRCSVACCSEHCGALLNGHDAALLWWITI